MQILWKRYSLGAILLAFLSLLIPGCGDYGAKSTVTPAAPPVTKTISGFVSYLDSGLPLPGATVTVYAVDANGVQASSTLPGSGFAISDVDGSYSLKIPVSYTGSLIVQASAPGSQVSKAAKSVRANVTTKIIRSAVPASVVSQAQLPQVMVSFATDAVVAYLQQNVTPSSAPAGFTVTGFSSDNIRKANAIMEGFFGANFSQVPPPASDAALHNSSSAQQNLTVSIQAFNKVITGPANTSINQIVVQLATTGLGSLATDLNAAVTQVVTGTLANQLPADYQQSPAIVAAITGAAAPVTAPDLTDTTPPTAPATLVASAASASQVNLSWSAATDAGSGVAGYNVYRALSGGSYALIASLGKNALTYSDTTVAPLTAYDYKVSASDLGNNTSGFSNVATLTTPAAANNPPSSGNGAVWTISGKVTANGVALPGVLLHIAGAGTGSAFTAADGSYSFFALDGAYVITPELPGYQFSPFSKSITVSGADLPSQDFGAVQNGSATGTVTYPSGSLNGSVSYPNGSVTTGVTYPSGTVIGGVSYPAGTVVISITYANGAVVAGVSYPAGTVVSTIKYPNGAVVGGVSYPSGTVVVIVTYANGTISSTVTYPTGTVVSTTSYPNGTVVTSTSYPNGTVTTSVSYPSGVVIGGVSYPAGTVLTNTSYPNGTTATTVAYPGGGVSGDLNFP